jgi:peptide/nickel transport system permease protein
VLGLYMVLWVVMLTLLTPHLATFPADQIDVGPHQAPPSLTHLMGTDDFGRDLYSRVLYGARVSMTIGLIAVGLAGTLGTAVGSVAGYFGGRVDAALMWCTDLLLALPRLVLVLAIVGIYRAAGASSLYIVVAVLGLTGWMGIARIVRAQVLALKAQDFVQATVALGLPSHRILLGHILPNSMAPILVYSSLAIGGTILTEAALTYLGLGVPPPTATWGALVNDGREFMRSAWWIAVLPGIAIVFTVMSFNLLGDGLRDALDPKMRGRQ